MPSPLYPRHAVSSETTRIYVGSCSACACAFCIVAFSSYGIAFGRGAHCGNSAIRRPSGSADASHRPLHYAWHFLSAHGLSVPRRPPCRTSWTWRRALPRCAGPTETSTCRRPPPRGWPRRRRKRCIMNSPSVLNFGVLFIARANPLSCGRNQVGRRVVLYGVLMAGNDSWPGRVPNQGSESRRSALVSSLTMIHVHGALKKWA